MPAHRGTEVDIGWILVGHWAEIGQKRFGIGRNWADIERTLGRHWADIGQCVFDQEQK